MNTTILGIDLAKHVFQLHGADEFGKAVLKKQVSRVKLTETVAQLPRCRIVMEACGGSHYWARKFKEYGHEVQLISPQFVKPFVKGNKSDRNDAEAIVEAASRPSMRYVSPKTIAQQDMQSLLRMRESCIEMRTKLSNQLRGLLGEYGVVISQGFAMLHKSLPSLYDRQKENGLTECFKGNLELQYSLLLEIDKQIERYDSKVKAIAKTEAVCESVQKVEGIGPITAVALAATIGQPSDFKNGRHFAAFLGLVPRQHSSGGKERLLGISKRGDGYLRKLLVQGARSVLIKSGNKKDSRHQWLNELSARRGSNRACVALANKNARIVLTMLKKGEAYRPAVNGE